ncbi:zinc-binding alcohol dehydrogenase family protein [Vibrio sp. RM-44-3]|uniref:quinone oxidoreductase family protein n=1 Tax=unclassified Vibrio TaxID=2614977 RepID=UPI00215CFFB4|nr:MULTISPECIES: zinc-binding alcohol dehydrogenase family protein [unclassified Vibrio]MCR9550184.1 zinc-binding alcohol dehydrogenase family protein [Vibrio sp. RM-41-2A]MCR9556275.1 zinc-binding alcohol dehydrogenase family protein [Vibrio sp. RM-41-2B]MCR9624152.1 zinc-binding alcohol dehydrogenase family protein [Vibrio sp. RM-44-3]
MKAVQLKAFGGIENLVTSEVEKPTITSTQILIKVAFSGINYADTYIRKGAFPGLPTPPFTLGMEGSGIVELVGNDVKNFQVGELVAFAGNQTYAEYVIIDTQSTQSWEVAVPVTLQKDIASSIAMSARTAMLLTYRVNHAQNKIALVHGAAGSVGSVLVQLLKKQGYTVIGFIGSDDKYSFVKELGSDVVLNYKNHGLNKTIFKQFPEGLDLIFNATGGDTIARDIELLAENGHIIWYGFAQSNQAPQLESAISNAFMKSIKFEVFNGGSVCRQDNIRAIKELEELIQNNELKIHIHSHYPLDCAFLAHEELEQGQTQGKLLLQVE